MTLTKIKPRPFPRPKLFGFGAALEGKREGALPTLLWLAMAVACPPRGNPLSLDGLSLVPQEQDELLDCFHRAQSVLGEYQSSTSEHFAPVG